MRRTFLLVAFIVVGGLLLTGCGDMKDMLEKATQRTTTVEYGILDSQSDSDVKSVLVAEGVNLASGDTQAVGEVNIDSLSERIEVSRLGLGDVTFFITGRLRNEGHVPAFITLAVIPADGTVNPQPVEIGTVTLDALEDLTLTKPGDMDQSFDSIHQKLKAVFDSLDARYLINPVLNVQGSSEDGVVVQWLKVAALPMIWTSQKIPAGVLSSYKDNLRNIYDATLKGSITNHGDDVAEVRLYLGDDKIVDPEADLVALAYVAPGETMQGFDMLVEGGAAKIKDTFESLADGKAMTRDFIVVSTQPLKVKGDKLRIEAKVVVGLNVF